MSASATNMMDFINALQRRVPYVHPMSQQIIHEYISDMRNSADDPVEVLRLMNLVRSRIARELRWEADDVESCGYFKEAFKLRRRADKFEVAHP